MAARNNTKEKTENVRAVCAECQHSCYHRHTVLKLRKGGTEGVWPKSPVRISPATVYKQRPFQRHGYRSNEGQAEFASVLTSPMQNKQNPKEPNEVLGQTFVC